MAHPEESVVNLVTLADAGYAARALSMAHSLDLLETNYHLWLLCLDDTVAEIFSIFHPGRTTLLKRETWENDALLSIKSQRTFEEYCWTLTPHSLHIVFEKFPEVNVLFYVDADVSFVRDPTAIYNDFIESNKDVFATLHAFSPRLRHLREFGLFNVQFLGFKRIGGSAVLREWRDQCTEWCFARHENGQFGDQKYLDSWPEKYSQELSIGQPESDFQGPWNVERFSPSEPLTYHFSSLKLLTRKYVQLAHPGYPLPADSVQTIYLPYVLTLRYWTRKIRRHHNAEPVSVARQLARLKRSVANMSEGKGFREFVPRTKNIHSIRRQRRLRGHPGS